MDQDLFYSCHYYKDVNTIQSWCEPALNHINYVDNFHDLAKCHKKIILLHPTQANGEFDLTLQLVKQKNYLLFVNMADGTNFKDYISLVADLPNGENFPKIFPVVPPTNVPGRQFNTNWFYFKTFQNANVLRAKEYTTKQIYETKNKPFKFLFLNGANRLSRQKLWHEINNNGLLEHSLHSYLGYGDFPWISDPIPIKNLPPEYDSYLTNPDATKKQHLIKDYLKFKHELWNIRWTDGDIVPSQYINTYFSVSSETTSLKNHGQFLTEKLYKSILAGAPFIMLGGPGYYDHLHELGFQTFHGLIDESFDQEDDEDRRIAMITQEIKKLCNSDLDKFLADAKEICLHNQNHYINSQYDMYKRIHYELIDFIDQVKSDAEVYFNSI